MKLHDIWHNYNFWFKLSLVAVMIWLIFSLTIALIIYLAWPYYFPGFEGIVFRFLTWFFLLPAVAILGLINAVPFIIAWLFEDVEIAAVSRQPLPLVSSGAPLQKPVFQSYKDVALRLDESYMDDKDLDLDSFD